MSTQLFTDRYYTAGNERDVVLFRIGMRINGFRGLRGLRETAGTMVRMPRMLIELGSTRALGMLASSTAVSWGNVEITQFWRSYEDLDRYASARDRQHAPGLGVVEREREQDGRGRHLARDLPHRRRDVRVDLRFHAAPRPRARDRSSSGRPGRSALPRAHQAGGAPEGWLSRSRTPVDWRRSSARRSARHDRAGQIDAAGPRNGTDTLPVIVSGSTVGEAALTEPVAAY